MNLMINRIEEFPIPLVFKLIGRGKSSGELVVRSRNSTRKFYFTKGKHDYSISDSQQERLVEILLLMGLMDRDQAVKIKAKTAMNPSAKVGRILVEEGVLTQKKLYDCLIAQSIQIAANAFGLVEGEWEFTPAETDYPPEKTYRIDLARVIGEGVKKIYDFSTYKSLFGRCLIKAGLLPEKTKKLLSPFELKFLIQITAQQGKTVSDILRKVTFPAEIFWRETVKLYLLNALEFQDTDKWASNTDTMVQAEVDMGATKPSAAKMREMEHIPSAGAPLPFDPEKDSDLFAEDGDEESPTKMETAPVIETSDSASESSIQRRAQVSFQMAEKLYNDGKYKDASLILSRAVRPESSPGSHFLLLGLCYSHLTGRQNEAEQCLILATEKDPGDPDPLFALGDLYRNVKKGAKALEAYRMALKLYQGQSRAEEDPESVARKKFFFTLRKK